MSNQSQIDQLEAHIYALQNDVQCLKGVRFTSQSEIDRVKHIDTLERIIAEKQADLKVLESHV